MTNDTIQVKYLKDTLLTTSEAAAMLNAHPNTIRRWTESGLLNCYRVGPRGHRRFRIEELEDFLGEDGA